MEIFYFFVLKQKAFIVSLRRHVNGEVNNVLTLVWSGKQKNYAIKKYFGSLS